MNQRWWEYYFVRYLLGTVVGAFVVYCIIRATYQSQTPFIITDDKVNYFMVFILLFMGFSYCYVSSTPMLTVHAVRGIFRVKTVLFITTISTIISGILLACLYKYEPTTKWYICPYIFTVSFQACASIYSLCTFNNTIGVYYKKLAEKRSLYCEHDKSKPLYKEYIESYRHLREHGNATAIVVFELILGAALYSTNSSNINIKYSALVLFIWIVPACISWVIGTIMEKNMVNWA